MVEEVPPPPMLEEVQREEKLSPAPTSGPSTSDQATQPRSTIAIDHQHRQRRNIKEESTSSLEEMNINEEKTSTDDRLDRGQTNSKGV